MKLQAPFADVLGAVRDDAPSCEYAIEVDEPYLRRIAGHLGMTWESSTREQRDAQLKLAGQARRALNKLAEEMLLFKASDGQRAQFYTQEAHARYLRRQAERGAQQQAVTERVHGLRHRMHALGVEGVNYTDNYGRVTMDLDMLTALVGLAERATERAPS